MFSKAPNGSQTVRSSHTDNFPLVNDLNAFLFRAKVQFKKKWENSYIPRADLGEFKRMRVIGEGAYGRVYLVKHKPTDTYCAMKVLEKGKTLAKKQVDHAYSEMKILLSIRFPFLMYMMYVIKDNSYVYFILPFIIGGEMFTHLQKLGRFSEDLAKFYAAQVCLALEYLHFLNILYRDLKPENILIDKRGYLKITDMGFSKLVKGRTYSFCGTPEYLAPEIVLHRGYDKSVDWWSYGVLLYEMCTGQTPFYAREQMRMYENIVRGTYELSAHFSSHLKDLISRMLQVDPVKRLGSYKRGVDDIKNHKWFQNIKWLNILNCKVSAPYLPKYTSDGDTSNFMIFPVEPLRFSDKNLYEEEFEKF